MSVPPAAGSSGSLAGRVAVVTGAARGIGLAVASALADEGARVIAADLAPTNAEARVETVECDVADPAQVDKLLAGVLSRHGRLDVLVNNAGVPAGRNLRDVDPDLWDRVLDVNLRAQFLCARAAAAALVEQRAGCIINLSSIRAQRAFPGDSPYIAAKGGVEALTRALAIELGPFGIRVNAIAPGAIETNLNRRLLTDPVHREEVLARIPLGRLGTPADVADAAVFLASDRAAFISGTVLCVDGGQTAGQS